MKRKISADEIKKGIEDYFHMCDEINCSSGEIVKPYTLSGLLFHLGITRDEYRRMLTGRNTAPLLQTAGARIEAFIEENVLTGELSVNAGANSLKYNFGWGEKKGDSRDDSRDSLTVSLAPEAANLAK